MSTQMEMSMRGEWKNGHFNGQGTFTQAHGGIVKGEWKDDILWNGKYSTYRIGNAEYTVTVENGEMQGTIFFYDGEWIGNIYEGELKDYMFNGQGTLTQAHGGKAKGEWKNDIFWNGNCYKFRIGDARIYRKSGKWKNTRAEDILIQGEEMKPK